MSSHRLTRRSFVAAAAAVAALGPARRAVAAPLQGHDWPNFRGPDHTGISAETGWLTQWPKKGPPIAWRRPIGIGFASMAVADGRVYASGNAERQEHIHCLDAATGKPLWRFSYPGALVNSLHEGGTGATPTVDEDKLHTLGREGQVHCFEAASGKPIWQADLRQILGIETPEWGFTSSPLIEGDLVIYQAGATLALNKNTGKFAWKSDAYKPAYSTPTLFNHGGKRLLASLNSAGMAIIDVASGKQLAFTPFKADHDTNACSPIISGDKIFLSRGYNGGCELYQFTGSSLNKLYANKAMSNHMNTSVLVDGHLYGFDGDSRGGRRVALVCMDFATGKEKWRKTGAETGLNCGSLIVADKKLICLGDQGLLAIAEASPEGYRELAKAQITEDKCWTTPVLSHGRIYVRNAPGQLTCVDVRPLDT